MMRHAVCIPFPAQGHLKPMLKLALILHSKGFHITYVHSDYNRRRILKSRGPTSLDGLPHFRYETFSDGLPLSDVFDCTQDILSLCQSIIENGPQHFRNLITKLNQTSLPDVPPVTCIISDGCMTFTLDVAEEMGIPELLFWTHSPCGVRCLLEYNRLVEKGILPLKDESYLVDEHLETTVDCINGMSDIRLKDMPSHINNPFMVKYVISETNRASKARSIILNTFYDLDHSILDSMKLFFPPIYEIGPLDLLCNQMIQKDKQNDVGCSMGSNLWKEDSKCLEWLDTKPVGSILYVNFGSVTVMTNQQMIEFAWGLCNSNKEFLWIIRPDVVRGETAVLPEDFLEMTKGTSMMTSWCSQEDVLSHPAIGGFLTHCGWNSTLESIYCGVPMLCWPFFAEQPTNCRYSCKEWGVGLEIDKDVKRAQVTSLIIELMDGEKGNRMRREAQGWKAKAIKATQKGGTSFIKMEKLLNVIC
ncbi:Flavonoid glucosyltransferase, family GT1 [Zostera marina]|uniref:Glycosyltransferase n=1 Tax=Zostera marina TaxID=29655 RepID=A0A0K9P689_ZOSMR|nr:Flavonoid glucosyltransferase, family GT1 [Zostera marina]